MGFEEVVRWCRTAGAMYGTEHRALFFYSLLRMIRPQRVLELGTGLAASAFCMAQALRDNRAGHVWTVDDGQQWAWESHAGFLERLVDDPVFSALGSSARGPELIERAAGLLGLSEWVSLIRGQVGLVDSSPVNAENYPFLAEALAQPIDLLFCDINTRPEACLITLRKYLPLLSQSASIFFDSASTFLPSFLALEHSVEQLNRGKLPALLLAGTALHEREQLRWIVATRRFSLVHLVEPGAERASQNGMAWLQIQPEGIFPYPLSAMRGMLEHSDAAISGASLREYLRHADEP